MRKLILLASVLLTSSVIFAQNVEFIRNGEVLADGSTITVTELETVMREMSPNVLVKNGTTADVPTVLKITVVDNSGVGFCGYCGFGTEQCVAVNLGASVARGMVILQGETVDPAIHWQGVVGKDPLIVNSTVKYELKTGCTLEEGGIGWNVIDEGTTISTVTVKFEYDSTSSINSLNTNSNISLVGNELTYNFDNAATRQLNIYNVTGSLVKSEALETSGTVVLNNMNKGVYIYEVIENGKRIAAHKCVIR